ncbi:IS30 family transposase [Lactiplantibacillus plantarum]|nr:IS30 family transposase [Lactiplantibacillus plantarum]MCG0906298.1 IS30 family transposase [Lactiplantibacillus plantarum]MCG0909465.1 IS30 family transposase [Lactiplantibacillus plantarum]
MKFLQQTMKEVFVLLQEQSITPRPKGHHLSEIERGQIAAWHIEGCSARQIAIRLGVCHQTVNNELKRGRVTQVKRVNNQKHYFEIYSPEAAQNRYEIKRQNCGRPLKFSQVTAFLAYFDDKFCHEGWSPDAAVGYARKHRLFKPAKMVCTKTLYNYIDAQLLEIRNLDLLEKTKRRTTQHHSHQHQRLLGRSIEERPKRVETRHEFGHFEIDTVIGKRAGSESVLLTFTERKTRYEIVRLIEGKDAESVAYAMQNITAEFGDVMRTVTADNGTEFTTLTAALEGIAETYYAHPYSSAERATNEVHNRILRRYFPKGQSLDLATPSLVRQAESRLNHLPRRLLKFCTPAEVFRKELARARKGRAA